MPYHGEFAWGPNAQMAIDTIEMKPTRGVPHWLLNVMEFSELDHFSGHAPGSYERDPERVYLDFQKAHGGHFVDQWIPTNPLSMKAKGFDHAQRSATTGAEDIVCDGMKIDSPEAVCEHLERFVWPALRKRMATFDADKAVADRIAKEREVQAFVGPNFLKVPYDGMGAFPAFRYGTYGYVNYFCAYALYPDVMARDFELQADMAVIANRASARAFIEGDLPKLKRLDHDMADSRGTLVRPETLDRIWLPQFARSIQPLLDAGVRLIWHCDGNLMAMVPRLIECGVSGFQGFQYEDGMDYEKICRMTDREGNRLTIWGGVSVTRTLPHGTPQQVRDEIKWLVKHAPPVGFFMGGSSSIAPGVPRANLAALFEGFDYYAKHGRG
ncbi:MAG: uroporphyrinogen decarboxylase family protein [Phycisphaerae bacterium]|nr:uroporphyrinogen decarboxylase family protein [Phycisphaerae bacterium]